jgi:hypothetical protein
VGRVAERRDRGDKMEGRRRLGVLAVAAAALAAAALLVLVARPRDEIRLKGAGAIVHRNRGGQVKVMSDADTIRAGDALRIVVTLPRSDRVEVWFVDAHGRIDRLLPEGAVDLGAGERALPGSAVVEAPCVDLWMVVATGSEVGPATESALQRAVAGGVHPGGAWSPAGSKVQALRCE